MHQAVESFTSKTKHFCCESSFGALAPEAATEAMFTAA
jgi:hypothetical protein